MKQTIIDPAKNICNGRGRNKRSGFVMIQCKSLRQRERLTGSVKTVEQMQENGENIKNYSKGSENSRERGLSEVKLNDGGNGRLPEA